MIVVYIPLQTIYVTHILDGEMIINGIIRDQGGPILSLFDNIDKKSQCSYINYTLKRTEDDINNKNLTCWIKNTEQPHNKPNHIKNIVTFIRRYLPCMTPPINQLYVKKKPHLDHIRFCGTNFQRDEDFLVRITTTITSICWTKWKFSNQ